MHRLLVTAVLVTSLASTTGCTANMFSHKDDRLSPRVEGLAVLAIGAAAGALGYMMTGACTSPKGCHEERHSSTSSGAASDAGKSIGEDIAGGAMGVALVGVGAVDVGAGLYQLVSGRYVFQTPAK